MDKKKKIGIERQQWRVLLLRRFWHIILYRQ